VKSWRWWRERRRQNHSGKTAGPAVRSHRRAHLLDGYDLREYDLADLRKNIGVIFQDYLRFQMTFRKT
jgi:hypothetical protein